ncbi:MAG: hypothetical protein LBU34_17095 [Planctomycetaceae bacterium]|jgi:hypothetical protein|nr:hypothetical protein [Planctomycetaceae bacterium]
MDKFKIRDRTNAQEAWDIFVNRYIELFLHALVKLREESDLDESNENSISERLLIRLRESCCEFMNKRDIRLYVPVWECPIQPTSLQDSRGGQLGKRPDFTCVFPNPRPGSHENYERYLHIECKVIGRGSAIESRDKRNYVSEGILRFDNTEHKYGKNAQTGIMIGYIVGETLEHIQESINGFIQTYINYHRPLQFDFNEINICQSHNQFERQHVLPVNFLLVHIWIDLRNN